MGITTNTPCTIRDGAKARKRRLARRQARQAKVKGKREKRYVFKVVRLNKEGSTVPEVRENQRMYKPFSLGNNKLYYIILPYHYHLS
jgi:hypothetical protein